jgi:hypothetical protein
MNPDKISNYINWYDAILETLTCNIIKQCHELTYKKKK